MFSYLFFGVLLSLHKYAHTCKRNCCAHAQSGGEAQTEGFFSLVYSGLFVCDHQCRPSEEGGLWAHYDDDHLSSSGSNNNRINAADGEPEPSFVNEGAFANVTAIESRQVQLECTVRNLGNKTVREKAFFCMTERIEKRCS